MGSSFKDAIDFARRTLSRSVDDDQPVATLYIAAIRNYLLRYSHDGKEAPVFIYNAVEQTALCLECYIEVKLKTMDGTIKVGSLDGWEDHIKIKHGAKSSVPTAKAPTPLQERPVLPSLGLRPFAHQSNKMGPRASGSHSHGKKRASSPEKSSSAALIDLTSPEARPPKKVKMEMPDQNAADAAQRRVDKAVNDRWDIEVAIIEQQTSDRPDHYRMRDLYQQLTANSIEINQAQLAVNTAQAALRYQQAQPVQQRFALPDKKPVIKAEPQQPVTGPSRGKLTPPSKKEKGRYDESDDDDDNRPRQLNDFIADLEDRFEGETSVEDARAHIGADMDNRIEGLQTSLKPHQILGVSWMLKQEESATKGGILADEMGLGKTFQTIALMKRNAPAEDSDRKNTLIIAPRAVLKQWEREIKNHCTDGEALSVLQYRGTNKPKSRREIRRYDVVLTNIHTFAAEQDRQGGEDHGPLLRMRWHRFVIDEAQIIRNRNGVWSKVVTVVDATYRWALTGTPITNTLTDVYSLLRWLRIAPWDDYPEFSRHIGRIEKRRPQEASERTQAILQGCMLRRRKDTQMNGKPLIQLPEKEITMDDLTFSPEELEVYNIFQAKIQAKVQKFIKKGTLLKKFNHVFVLLLRLRQACCHPALVQRDEDEAAKAQREEEEIKEALERAAETLTEDQVDLMKRRLLERAIARLHSAMGERDDEKANECDICMEPYDEDESILPCGHFYCTGCLAEAIEKSNKCPSCRAVITPEQVFTTKAFEPEDEEIEAAAEKESQKMGKKSRRINDDEDVDEFDEAEGGGKKKKGRKGGKKAKEAKGKGKGKAKDRDWEVVERACLPSVKVVHMLEILEDIEAKEPGAKTIVISSFTSYLSIVDNYLREKGYPTVRFQGDMDDEERDDAIDQFQNKSKIKVMLLSLKAGGVGLNLTAANHVIMLDMAWSLSVEEQAYDRVHRLGQTKDVVVHRMNITNTVEQRMMQLQAHKKGLANGALGEGDGRKLQKLTVKDIANLFGLDARGNAL